MATTKHTHEEYNVDKICEQSGALGIVNLITTFLDFNLKPKEEREATKNTCLRQGNRHNKQTYTHTHFPKPLN